jgi:hypothetical protein
MGLDEENYEYMDWTGRVASIGQDFALKYTKFIKNEQPKEFPLRDMADAEYLKNKNKNGIRSLDDPLHETSELYPGEKLKVLPFSFPSHHAKFQEKSSKISDKERFIWFLKTLREKGYRGIENSSDMIIRVRNLMVEPYFFDDIYEELYPFIYIIQGDKDFYRRHGMYDYKPHFKLVNGPPVKIGDDSFYFYDFSEDFIKEYMEDRLGVKSDTGLNNKPIIQKSNKKTVELREFPKDLTWEDITIKFLNGEEVRIEAKTDIYQTDYKLMGFQSEKTKRPNIRWTLLKIFARKGGFLDWENNSEFARKDQVNMKKRKQLLSETLRAYFHGVEGDPFLGYRKEGCYKIRINLEPEATEQNNGTDDDLSHREFSSDNLEENDDGDDPSRDDWVYL